MNCQHCGAQITLSKKYSRKQIAARRFCSSKCAAAVNPPPVFKAGPVAPRFWKKVDTSGGPDACWPWTASTDDSGYGLFKVAGRLEKAHRYAFKLSGRPMPHPDVLHECDNPPCCNERHLYSGTAANNASDREVRGRSNRRVGEHHGNAAINDAVAISILIAPQERGTGRLLAARYGITEAIVSNIRRGKTWRHLHAFVS